MSQKRNYIFYDALITIIKTNIEFQFEKQLNVTFLIVATVLHLFFKAIWLKNKIKKDI